MSSGVIVIINHLIQYYLGLNPLNTHQTSSLLPSLSLNLSTLSSIHQIIPFGYLMILIKLIPVVPFFSYTLFSPSYYPKALQTNTYF